ncbi:MAG: hypothetical protein A2275_15840 [Bacteroidetes bacterium RIFOXYA12_FULL_35_11]|nr:MAG: hypothetical protein A2X01_05585 [Bacteroidetes bacterium GWF2_35_48]OFY79195.1 MAG: hypothetical protein A2275_15840 [Bacteroidetes bacterium RIFOXYA12_FULL_35_11]OFY94998.1 MAG: hypothetical protein A2309_10835 [Bacteroidetes bacterium RIFOXYB2_FULL_35_7]HBX52227.1 hypothetical protein [Bacteroidales bacterium]
MLLRKIYIIIFFFCIFFSANSQTVFNFRLGYLGFHPGRNSNSSLYENSISENGDVVIEPSLWFGLESFIREDHTSIQFYQGFLADAAARSAGFSHVGIKRRLIMRNRLSMFAEIGTTLSYRENWAPLAGYNANADDFKYEGIGKWQTKWIWVSGGLSWYFYLTKKHDMSFAVWYGHYEKTITLTLGYRYWFSVIFKHPKPCKCPFDKYDKKYKRS